MSEWITIPHHDYTLPWTTFHICSYTHTTDDSYQYRESIDLSKLFEQYYVEKSGNTKLNNQQTKQK